MNDRIPLDAPLIGATRRAPLEVNPISRMTDAETKINDLLREIASAGDQGGPILVKLAADLDYLIENSAEFPALISQWLGDLGDGTWGLMCPVCNDWVDSLDSLRAVDKAERQTTVSDIEGDPDAAPGEGQGVVTIHFDDRGDFGSTLYFLHESPGNPQHAVSLPSSWEIF